MGVRERRRSVETEAYRLPFFQCAPFACDQFPALLRDRLAGSDTISADLAAESDGIFLKGSRVGRGKGAAGGGEGRFQGEPFRSLSLSASSSPCRGCNCSSSVRREACDRQDRYGLRTQLPRSGPADRFRWMRLSRSAAASAWPILLLLMSAIWLAALLR